MLKSQIKDYITIIDKLKQKLIDRIILTSDESDRQETYQFLYNIFNDFDADVTTVDQFIGKISMLNDRIRAILRKQYNGLH